MKNGWTTHLWNGAIWLALSSCYMTMTCKINKLEKPGGPLRIFHTLFGRSAAFYGHFWANTVTSEWSIHISSSHHTTSILAKLSTWCSEHSGDISCSLLINCSHTDESCEVWNTCMWIYIYIYILYILLYWKQKFCQIVKYATKLLANMMIIKNIIKLGITGTFRGAANFICDIKHHNGW